MFSKLVVKPIEKSAGVGQVLNGKEPISRVQYDINIFQELRIYEYKEMREEVEGQKTMEGNLAVLEKGINLRRTDDLTLHIQDGREIDFTITGIIDKANNRYGIKSSAELYWI